MNSHPLISAIVPIQNLDEDKENILSWFKDSISVPFEIIFCYDSDLKNAQEILEATFSKIEDFNFKYISGDFKSPGMARNEGLKHSSGSWICFWDSDDQPDLIAFADMIPVGSDYEVVAGSFLVVNQMLSTSRYYRANRVEDSSGFLSLMLNPGIWRFCFSAKKIAGLKFQDLLMAEDQLFITDLLLRDPKMATTESVVYRYRVGHHGRLTSNPRALQHLIKSAEYLRNLQGVRDNAQKRLVNLVLVKQFVTYLKKAGPNYQWSHCRKNVAFFMSQPATTVRNILFIIKNWN